MNALFRLLLVVVNSTQFSPQFENAVIISIQKLLSERQEPDSVLMFIVGHISFRFVSTNVRDFDVPGEVLSSKTIGLILICRLIKRTPLLNSRDIIRLVECFQDSFARIIDSSLVAGLHLITLISEMLNDETLKVNRGEDFDDLVFRLIQARECCLNHVFKVFGFVERFLFLYWFSSVIYSLGLMVNSCLEFFGKSRLFAADLVLCWGTKNLWNFLLGLIYAATKCQGYWCIQTVHNFGLFFWS